MKDKQVDTQKSIFGTLVSRFKESNLYWVIWGDKDLEQTREESRQHRYGKADKRAE